MVRHQSEVTNLLEFDEVSKGEPLSQIDRVDEERLHVQASLKNEGNTWSKAFFIYPTDIHIAK